MTYNAIRPSLSFLENDFTPHELASLYPNERVGLRRAQNAGCCEGGVRDFAHAVGFDAPPTLAALAGLLEPGTWTATVRHRRHYIAAVVAYTVGLRLSRHKFVRRQYLAHLDGRITHLTYRDNVRHYTQVLVAARTVGRMGI
jgi:hypothetical protein